MTDGPSSEPVFETISNSSPKPSSNSSLATPSPPHPEPSVRGMLLLTILAALLAFAVCLGLRLAEAPAWEHDHLQVRGEPLMATHDAYYFLAGAQGTGRPNAAHEPFFQLTRFFRAVTGMSYDSLGFWLPVFLAPLVIFPLAFLAWREGLPEAVLPMGILAGGTLGFFLRTRLGYYDHDMLSLLLPVLLATGLLVFLEKWLRPAADANDAVPPDCNHPVVLILASCLALGALGLGYLSFYASGRPILTAVLAVAALLGLVCSWNGMQRSVVLAGMGAIFLLSVNWIWGLAVLGGLALALGPLSPWLRMRWAVWGLAGLALAAVVFGGNLDAQFAEVLRQLGKYAAFGPEGNQTARELIWPSVMQSVREARLLSPFFMAERSGVTWWLFAAGVTGYGYLCWRRPFYLMFLPFLALSIGAVKLGARFTMYGGVPAGLGLGLGLALLLRNMGLRQRAGAVVLTAFGLVAGLLLWVQVEPFTPRPILSKPYAQTLLELRELTPPDARIWLWWDYGYATQYYAQRASFGDGTLNSSTHLYPMALVHATASPRQAAQMIKLVTAGQMTQLAVSGQPVPDPDRIPWNLYLQSPLRDFRDLSAEAIQEIVDALATKRLEWPKTLPAQYLLLSWDNLALAGWITTFGNWDPRSGQGRGGRIQRIAGDLSVDMDAGLLQTASNETLKLDGYLLVSQESRNATSWDNDSGWHGLYNDATRQFLIMDETVFRSMLVRMLLEDPHEFAEDFELVVDNYPWARVYQVR
jgi:hypothetical protein